MIKKIKNLTNILGRGSKFKLGIGLVLGGVGLSGCVTTDYGGTDRYARLYDACDAQAGACYRSCDSVSNPNERRVCKDDCSVDADQCFADLNRLIRKESLYEVTRNNYYGRYGAWYHGEGYRFGPHGFAFGYPYRYRGYYYRPPNRDRDTDEREVYDVPRSTGKPNKPNPRTETFPGDRPRTAPPTPVDRSTGRTPTNKTRVTPPPKPTKPTVTRPTPKPRSTPKPPPRQKSPAATRDVPEPVYK